MMKLLLYSEINSRNYKYIIEKMLFLVYTKTNATSFHKST